MYSDDAIMFTRLSPAPLAFKEEYDVDKCSRVLF